ncbi:MAG: 4Fe-4S binding protein, partial [Deltaproteobacteria bacterium]|nr:4Fe-4S binding protein [Deltaproteobacteria bacterium]
VCRARCRFEIDGETCTGCTLCAKVCPVSCIAGEKKAPHRIDPAACVHCGACFDACTFDAIRILGGEAR